MVRYLLDHSPFKALIDFAEIRNLFVPCLHSRYTASKSALSTACEGPEDAGDASQYGLTPLAAACAVGSIELIHLLLESGANKDKTVWRLSNGNSNEYPGEGQTATHGNDLALVKEEVATMREALARIYGEQGDDLDKDSSASSHDTITVNNSSIVHSLQELALSAQKATTQAHFLREALLMVRPQDLCSLLQAACNKNTPSIKKIVVILIMVLKTSRIFPNMTESLR